MARRVYFAFHYQNDISRVNVVRNSWLTHKDRESAGFFDASLWETAKKNGDAGIRRMIQNGLDGTSVTVFLLGSETARRPWVRFELEESYKRGNGMLAIRINGIKSLQGLTSANGENIFATFTINDAQGNQRYLSDYYSLYDWGLNDGYRNIGTWVEQAAKAAGR
ncbi:hypothetical protein SV7mr_19720 [Stieleria bergensis]|uniref:Thoeris protein ThsB TIR-like domain-containing protein n=1 Tax=Stieleria bergensis TaxID=2528025 RepID=A0A517STK3_9BACT|nr:hypothetical protein SV7mr_19720 [Planctomycetes bacterium SV_7m_r]